VPVSVVSGTVKTLNTSAVAMDATASVAPFAGAGAPLSAVPLTPVNAPFFELAECMIFLFFGCNGQGQDHGP